MKVIEQIRVERLAALRDDLGGFAALNRALERSARDATLSQIFHGAPDSVTGKTRAMGSILARQIETKLNKPVGWMDSDPDAWPFPNIPRERFELLEDFERVEIQGKVREMILHFENEKRPKTITRIAPLASVPPKQDQHRARAKRSSESRPGGK